MSIPCHKLSNIERRIKDEDGALFALIVIGLAGFDLHTFCNL
jgi:hypothetical protein